MNAGRPDPFLRFPGAGEVLPHLVALPDGYAEAPGPWPLVLFLHGAGEGGHDLDLVLRHGPPRLVNEGERFPFLLACPQCPEGRRWPVGELDCLLDDLVAAWDVDPDRVLLTGLSMGGYGAWSLAATRPDRFAALAPVCGGGPTGRAARLRHLPIWAFHGALDPIVPVDESQQMVAAVRAAGGHPRLTVYPDVGHDAWDPAYRDPELYRWLLLQRRDRPDPCAP